jgi:plastocyanin
MTQSVFTGKVVTGPATVDYSLKALPPGVYHFRCQVHPTQMTGELIVAAG